MTLDVAYEFLNLEINKVFGSYFAPEELDVLVDRAQMATFNDYYEQFGASQRVNGALAPFKKDFQFTLATCPAGLITVPIDYEQLLAIYTTIQNGITGQPQNRPVPIMNDDEKVWRDNNQIYPPSLVDPYGVIKQHWNVQLYPTVPQAGMLTYLSRPPAPVFGYSVVSGRVIVYNPTTSTQLQWADKDQTAILVLALSYLGINLREEIVIQYAETKTQQNLTSPNKL